MEEKDRESGIENCRKVSQGIWEKNKSVREHENPKRGHKSLKYYAEYTKDTTVQWTLRDGER